MIQDIGSARLYNSFINEKPAAGSTVLQWNDDGKLLVGAEEDRLVFPKWEDASAGPIDASAGLTDAFAGPEDAVYLFSVDDKKYFMLLTPNEEGLDGFQYRSLRELRGTCCNESLFVAFTAYHLWVWYRDNRFCGRCGSRMMHDGKERALHCEKCGNMVYPRINPAVIVGVISGNRLLITRYRRGYANNALVAGFTEIGETMEQTVAREVMEETGIRVKNIRYYKSQPWGMAQDMLIGFFCETDGSCEIHMDEDELKYAEWTERDRIELQPSDISLTNDMMKAFKNGEIHEI